MIVVCWLRSDGEHRHCHAELAVSKRTSRLRSGGEHCQPELAVEDDAEDKEEQDEEEDMS